MRTTSDDELPAFARHVQSRLAGAPPSRNVLHRGTPSAVLAALFERDAEPYVWLLRKSEKLRSHGGQVALPGGKADPGDASLVETALREAHEEVGLPREHVRILGALDPFPTITGYLVSPFVGLVPDDFAPVPDASEVARVFPARLATFASEPELRDVSVLSWRRLMPSYEVDGEIVWGATLSILQKLARKLA